MRFSSARQDDMAEIVYALCAFTSVACAWLLLRKYRQAGSRLLLWSGVCFVGLAINNILLFVDLIVFPTAIDLSVPRFASALFALLILLSGLVWESR